MNKGTVKWYNGQRGYGFIQPVGGDKDMFVPRYGLERSGIGVLSEGQKVIYELQTDRRTDKTSAVNLKLAA